MLLDEAAKPDMQPLLTMPLYLIYLEWRRFLTRRRHTHHTQ
jgi:hypothetical protein